MLVFRAYGFFRERIFDRLFFGGVIRFFLESYIDIALSVLMNL